MLFEKWRSLMTALFYLAIAFTLTMALLPSPPQMPGNPGDKMQHMAAFATLTLLAIITFPPARYVRIFLTLAALGALIEILQAIPRLHRDAEVADWVADCGAVLAVLLLAAICQRLMPPSGRKDMKPDDR